MRIMRKCLGLVSIGTLGTEEQAASASVTAETVPTMNKQTLAQRTKRTRHETARNARPPKAGSNSKCGAPRTRVRKRRVTAVLTWG